ncbi:trypsin-like peptidase domain-containing protein [Roseovarius ramblicola]|uniref:Trypsin-like peptidase domain-containing protein n=1 Tax=Roseovarius ramblicola TaxID=2022336 RepID=A0ABV5I4B4_9RHOB
MFRRLCLVLTLLAAPAAMAQMRVPGTAAEIATGFVPVVREAAPAVVNIYASRVVESRRSPFMSDPFFGRFFREFGRARPRVQNSLGSGVILSPDGIVVSNYHVVGEATDIRVVLNDRREYAARVLLGDEESDLAILQVEDAPDLPALKLRDSDSVEVGELVLAIGNPFGVGQTVSSGIVSGLARSGTAMGSARGYFIQTDAPINPGNSGGALVDVNGQLIGINTAILSRSGGSNGIGFAIPADLVAQFVAQARAGNKSFERPWAGLSGQIVTPDMAEGLGLDRPRGLVISQVHSRSPFAGHLVPGDVVTAVDGEPVNSPAEMVYRLSLAGIGAEATVTRLRDGQAAQIPVALIAAPGTPPRDRRVTGRAAALPEVTLVTINPAVIDAHDLPLAASGVLIEAPGPYGGRVGLRAGDILREINGQETPDTATAAAALRAAGRTLVLGLVRDGRRLSLRLRL